MKMFRRVSGIIAALILATHSVDAQPLLHLPPLGTIEQAEGIAPGYTLIAPLSSEYTFLINNDGRIVHSWHCGTKPGQAAYLLEDGTLLRAAKADEFFQFPEKTGCGGRVQKFDWDGNLLWDFVTASPVRMTHHDIEPLPNGNVLMIAWESYLREVAERNGRNPMLLDGDVLWLESIFEVRPDGPTGGEVVWKWSLLDHLVQDWDETQDNFGDPAEHPELVNINFMQHPLPDWIHMNSIDYHPELDQIVVGSRTLNEFWIIDHSTTTEEAAGHSGGRRGKGGDLLYRWGNPAVHRLGTPSDRMLFHQHDVQWIEAGRPGAGNILLYNNGEARTVNDFSSVDELTPPLTEDGLYFLEAGKRYGPEKLTWTFEDPLDLFSPRISGAQRLPNGNTLICSGTQSVLQEVTPDGRTVWVYRNPPRFVNVDDPQPGSGEPPADEDEFEDDGSPDRRASPRGRRDEKFPYSIAKFPQEVRDRIRIPGGIPLEHGGTMFRATKYPPDFPAFRGRDMNERPFPLP